jgi:hypothetical protein
MAFALVSLSLTARYLTLSTSLVPVLAAIGLWGVTAWALTLTHSSIADLGSVGGSCVAASLVL